VLFEFGPSRQQELALRSHIREWQPQLRTLFLIRITLFRYRLQLPGFELPEAVRASQLNFDRQLAVILDRMADRMEGQTATDDFEFNDAFEHLERTIMTCCLNGPQQSSPIELKTFLALSRSVESLAVSLQTEILLPNSEESA
jgi:multidrug resistance protein MdtO